MCRFNIFVIQRMCALVICGFVSAAYAEESKVVFDANSRWDFSVGYMSWQENLNLQNGNSKDYGLTNFSGNSFNISRESYLESAPRHGLRLTAGMGFGVATAGGTQPTLSYQFSNLSWTSEYLSVLYAFQLSPSVNLCAGPFMLARQISYQTLSNGTSASSGASSNFGEEGDLRVAFNPHWTLNFQFATLSSNASTLWDFAIGYLF